MGDVQAGAECTDVGVGERLKFAFPGLCHKGDDGHGLNTDSAVGLVAFIVLIRGRIKPTTHKKQFNQERGLTLVLMHYENSSVQKTIEPEETNQTLQVACQVV